MKESNITSALVKSKMSGFEVGRLMMQDFLYGMKQAYDGTEDPRMLLNPQEVQYIQDQLTDSYDIKIYNSCRRLWEYLDHIAYMTTITKQEIDIIAFKLYILITGEIKADTIQRDLSSLFKNKAIDVPVKRLGSTLGLINLESDNWKDKTVVELFNMMVDRLRRWYAFLEALSLISERMELPDIMILADESPTNKVKLVNALIQDLQFLCPENKISKALFNKGIGHICGDDEIPKDINVIDIEKLKPSDDKINAAKEAIKDLTYFKSNWGIHTILGIDAERLVR